MGSFASGLRFLALSSVRSPVFPSSFVPPSATRAVIPSCGSTPLQGVLPKVLAPTSQ